MCLAVPVEVKQVGPNETLPEGRAEVEIDGVTLQVGTALVERVAVGDWVLLHAGYIIEVLSQEKAQDQLSLFKEFYERVGEPHER